MYSKHVFTSFQWQFHTAVVTKKQKVHPTAQSILSYLMRTAVTNQNINLLQFQQATSLKSMLFTLQPLSPNNLQSVCEERAACNDKGAICLMKYCLVITMITSRAGQYGQKLISRFLQNYGRITIYTTQPTVCWHPFKFVDLTISVTPVADMSIKLSTQPRNLHRQTLAVE
jgi:hypothetical protein